MSTIPLLVQQVLVKLATAAEIPPQLTYQVDLP
jgi:hypothetical protein